jgi:hypothetical protein
VSRLFLVALTCVTTHTLLYRIRLSAKARQATVIYDQENSKHSCHQVTEQTSLAPLFTNLTGTHNHLYNVRKAPGSSHAACY